MKYTIVRGVCPAGIKAAVKESHEGLSPRSEFSCNGFKCWIDYQHVSSDGSVWSSWWIVALVDLKRNINVEPVCVVGVETPKNERRG